MAGHIKPPKLGPLNINATGMLPAQHIDLITALEGPESPRWGGFGGECGQGRYLATLCALDGGRAQQAACLGACLEVFAVPCEDTAL